MLYVGEDGEGVWGWGTERGGKKREKNKKKPTIGYILRYSVKFVHRGGCAVAVGTC